MYGGYKCNILTAALRYVESLNQWFSSDALCFIYDTGIDLLCNHHSGNIVRININILFLDKSGHLPHFFYVDVILISNMGSSPAVRSQ